jgi:hypothetical protein
LQVEEQKASSSCVPILHDSRLDLEDSSQPELERKASESSFDVVSLLLLLPSLELTALCIAVALR